ncbi:MAG: ferric reductase-like transmembrane domain-containing protein [bacterium]|nr:ferric reductase-like transmembrane domain-containing protein [bacterium]
MRVLRLLLFFCVPSVISLILWLFAKITVSPPEDVFHVLTEICALLGLILISLSLILSTRLTFFERFFGGSDKVYYVHHLVGGIGFLLILAHPLLLVASVLPQFSKAAHYLIPGSYLPMTLGIFSLYIFLFSFICIFFVKLPFGKWLLSHRVMIVAYILGSIHALLADSDIRNYFPLYTYMLFFVLVGSFSGIYIIFFYSSISRKYAYRVQTVQVLGDTVSVFMKCVGARIHFHAGQFVYLKFLNPTVGMEIHPFTVSSGQDEEVLRISVKSLGDYTSGLRNVMEGDIAHVYGPYGMFGELFHDGAKKLIWIGGGVGVTPFLSMLHEEAIKPKEGKIHFFYSYQKVTEGVFSPEIKALLSYTPRVSFYDWCADSSGFLTATKIVSLVGTDFKEYTVLLCGPPGMSLALKKQFLEMGMSKDKIVFENFNFMAT